MITLIGLGNSASKIVENLKENEQYKIITIDSGKEIKEYSSPEEYEKNCPSFKKLFKGVTNEVYLFLSASGKISGSSLRILEQLKGKKLNVVCFCGDSITLSAMGILQQNLVTGVLQEYARSGLLESLILIDSSKIEDLLGDVSLDKYYDKMNDTISYLFHTFMYFDNAKPVFELGTIEKSLNNIKTWSIIDNNGQQKKLFDLKNETNELFYFSYNKEKNKNKNFLKDVKRFIQTQKEEKKIGAKIFETTSEDTNTYSVMSTHIVQSYKDSDSRNS